MLRTREPATTTNPSPARTPAVRMPAPDDDSDAARLARIEYAVVSIMRTHANLADRRLVRAPVLTIAAGVALAIVGVGVVAGVLQVIVSGLGAG